MAELKHESAKTLYRRLMGKSRELHLRQPRLRAMTEKLQADIGSPLHPTRLLALTKHDEMPVLLSEEDRETHMHLLGTTRQGKSKLMELLIRGDIERGFGCCLLDPSENGATATSVLKHCAAIGFEKVVYINPGDFDRFDAVPVINPFQYEMPAGVSAGNVKNALDVLWSTRWEELKRIEKYVPAVLTALHCAGATLADVKFFLDDKFWEDERERLLERLPPDSPNYVWLRRAFSNKNTFENHFQPTVNHLQPFSEAYLSLIFGSKQDSIPFADLIMEGWVIVANLDCPDVWGRGAKEPRLLGTMLINEILHGVHRAQSSGWRGRFYLYVDEVGDFATRDIAYVTDKKSKSGLRLTVAHQRFDQIENPNVLSAVRSMGNKVMFHVGDAEARRLMMRDMNYGGALPFEELHHEYGSIPKQEALFRINKQKTAVLARLVDVPEPDVSDQSLKAFKEFIYGEYRWMHPPKSIQNEMNARFRNTRSFNLNPTEHVGDARRKRQAADPSGKTSPRRAKADRKAARGAGQPAATQGNTQRIFSEEE